MMHHHALLIFISAFFLSGSNIAKAESFANGIDALEASDFKGLVEPQGKTCRIGVLTNQVGKDLKGRRTIDVLASAPGAQLAAIFAPEHSIDGNVDTTSIGNSVDKKTGVTVYSLYGAKEEQRRPPTVVMRNLDTVVYDLQDAGASFYTYETTLGYLLEAAQKTGTRILVLDRPNPINGTQVQGPITDGGSTAPGGSCEGSSESTSFIDYSPKPIRHGMTMGELALMFNAQIAAKSEEKTGAKLEVVKMQGWHRKYWFDETKSAWVNPSPNLRNLNETALYSGVALLEFSNVSVGRGTEHPFELVGSPWIKSEELSSYLNARHINGVRFEPCRFKPTSSRFEGQELRGIRITLVDRDKLDAPGLGIEIASALLKKFKSDFDPHEMVRLLGNRATYNELVSGRDPKDIVKDWTANLERWKKIREPYLIYQ